MSTPAERFWARVSVVDDDESCWLWLGCKSERGYGFCSVAGEVTSHRAAWVLTNGPILGGLWVCHRCDNPTCVRPSHLFLGTPGDNVRDMIAKGRGVPPSGNAHWMRQSEAIQLGDNNFNAKLSDESVAQIKASLVAGTPTSAIAAALGVAVPTVSLIASNTNWAHVPWPEGSAFSTSDTRARRARARRARRLQRGLVLCAGTNCQNLVAPPRERCAACAVERRRISKREHARSVRAANGAT